MEAPRTTVIIPTLNRRDLLVQSVLTFRKHHPEGYEIVVVDNGNDGTAEWCSENGVECLKPEEPLTFGESNNLAAKGRKTEFLLLLNNDTITREAFCDRLLAFITEKPDAVAVGPKIVNGGSLISHVGVDFDNQGIPFHPYFGADPKIEFVEFSRPVNALTAACILIRRDAWEKVHGFDPRYENNYEDVDLCLKFRERRWDLWYCHDAEVTHLENQTRGDACDIKPMLRVFLEKWVQSGTLEQLLVQGALNIGYEERRLNIGSGDHIAVGYTNVDIMPHPGVDVVRDVTKGLPFDNHSADRIYCKNLLEYLSGEEAVCFLMECVRVMKKDCVMTFIVPHGWTDNPLQKSVWFEKTMQYMVGVKTKDAKKVKDTLTYTLEVA